LSTGLTGFGTGYESEFVVLGGHPDDQFAIRNINALLPDYQRLHRRLDEQKIQTYETQAVFTRTSKVQERAYARANEQRALDYLHAVALRRFPTRFGQHLHDVLRAHLSPEVHDRLPPRPPAELPTAEARTLVQDLWGRLFLASQ